LQYLREILNNNIMLPWCWGFVEKPWWWSTEIETCSVKVKKYKLVLFWTKMKALVWSIEYNGMNAIKLTCYCGRRNCRFIGMSFFDVHLVLTAWTSVTRINGANIVFHIEHFLCKIRNVSLMAYPIIHPVIVA